jgi:hypothetical protein
MIAPLLAVAIMAAPAEPMTTTDVGIEMALIVVSLVDVGQTRYFLNHRLAEEVNPVLGRHPSPVRLYATVSAALLAHAVIARLLPQPYRGLWQASVFTIEIGFVGWNAYNLASFRLEF